MIKNFDILLEKQEQINRGLRIKEIREKELRLNKTDLAKQIGISSQFLGLVEAGRGNLTYRSVKLLRNLSGHSSDYILYGLDDDVLKKTKQYLSFFDEKDLTKALSMLRDISILLKKTDF